jgi:hypothetical protein
LFASFLALAPTAATAVSITSVSLSPDPPLALEPFALQIDFSYNSNCESPIGPGTPTTGPDSVSLDYFFNTGIVICEVQDPLASFQDQVPIGSLPAGDYTYTVTLRDASGAPVGGKPGGAYTGQFTVVPEPSVALLFASGLLALAIAGKARR